MRSFLTFIYGVLIAIALYFFVRMLYSVYYTPGSTVIYDSPIVQRLFPSAEKKLFPTWGFNKLGMYDGQPFKFGAGDFWPESGKGYVPKKYGSGGPSPSGGMRPNFSIPAETAVGFWGHAPKHPEKVHLDIYDDSTQHVEYKTPVGWWGN
jgi:hypothetical protein